jgi:predicted  nucleic acid-binding Zn-ribbon protein
LARRGGMREDVLEKGENKEAGLLPGTSIGPRGRQPWEVRVTEQNELGREIGEPQEQVQALRDNAHHITAQMGETKVSLSRNLERMLEAVHQLEEGMHELEAQVIEAHHDARRLRRQATVGHTAADRALGPSEPDLADLDQPPVTAKATAPGDDSNLERARGEQEEIQKQVALTLIALRQLLDQLKDNCADL